ncbi:MAG: maltotransferase domain-containing protein [Thermoprotei archaeon]
MEDKTEKPNQIVIERVEPQLDCGRFSVKRVQGDSFKVRASVLKPGSDILSVQLRYRPPGSARWLTKPMVSDGNDLWQTEIELSKVGIYEYTVDAWTDVFATMVSKLKSWSNAGEDVYVDSQPLLRILESTCMQGSAASTAKEAERALQAGDQSKFIELVQSHHISEAVHEHFQPLDKVSYPKILKVVVDTARAAFASWYELFPRSQTTDPARHGTLKDVVSRLDDIASMGFDVVYLTPIHPIGRTNRRGKNNTYPALPGDPGSPWAIGNENGGHKSIEPLLGSFDDLELLLKEVRRRNMDVALDLAFQCSPDHPYVREHPDWFNHRSDGSIRYAENPPKRYMDIYPLNFDSDDWKALWDELLSVVLFWVEHGIRIFRVDNPHTKPFAFWEWLIDRVKSVNPEVTFLAEAFTRPRIMYMLAKLGFSQSYTYFTWKNYDYEIKEYFSELASPEITEYFRPMLFTNTPDILTPVLQNGGRAAFKMRAILAATLSPLWGIYSGYELCENTAKPGTEEYLNSEKYEIKPRNWNAPGNIKQLISKLNEIRRRNRSLQSLGKIRFLDTDNPNLVFYCRYSEGNSNSLYIVVNINPFETHSGFVEMPIKELGLKESDSYTVEDLLNGDRYVWKGTKNFVSLTPDVRPAHILKVYI